MPVPFPVRGVPTNIVFPMPPQGSYQGPHPQMRAPGKVFHQQGSGSGPQPQFSHPNFYQFQQQQQQHRPTPGPIIVSTPSGDAIIQKASEINIASLGGRQHHSGENRQQQQLIHGHPAGLVPPLPHPQQMQQQRFQQQQQQQPQHRSPGMSSAEITKNIIRELFDRKPPGKDLFELSSSLQ